MSCLLRILSSLHMLIRMPNRTIYLPDDLDAASRALGLNLSRLTQDAISRQLQDDPDAATNARVEAAMRSPAGGVDSEKLETAIGELALAVRTLQRLMIDKGVCSAEELHQKLQQVDLEDGKADGRTPI